MKELFLIPVILAAAAFGFYIMTRVDRFIEENRRLIDDSRRSGLSRIHIAADSPLLLTEVAPALARCAEADPHIEFFLSSGPTARILEKLMEEQVDIVLLGGGEQALPKGQYAVLSLSREPGRAQTEDAAGQSAPAEEPIRAVWKKACKSRDRDRVIFALENGNGPQPGFRTEAGK